MTPQHTGLSELTFELMVESGPNAIVVINNEGKIVYANAKTEALFGYSKSELTGQLAESLFSKNYLAAYPQTRTMFLETTGSHTMSVSGDLIASRKDGTEFTIEIGLNHINTGDGALIVASITDITERAKQEAIVKKQLSELKVAGNYLEQLAYISAHDIKSPIITLGDLVNELLNSKDLKPDDLQMLRMQKKVIMQMQRTNKGINDILKLRQGLLTKETADSGQMPLGAILANITDTLRADIENTGAELNVNLNGLSEVQFPYFYLQSAFYNLLTNAIKYRHPNHKPIISFEAKRLNAQTFHFTISDNGLGFDMETTKSNMFGIFKRFHPKIEGTGLGLHIVKSIVDAYGGEITVNSEIDKGTTFDITLKNPILAQ